MKKRGKHWQGFYSKVDKSQGPLGCWKWTGFIPKNGGGYGKVGRFIDGKVKVLLAHRVSFEMMYGDMIKENECVCHTCDNRACVNPLHLFLGSRKDNNNDCRIKGRTLKGSKHNLAKLTEAQVLEIKKKIKFFKDSVISKDYNVTPDAIHKIRIGANWGWL